MDGSLSIWRDGNVERGRIFRSNFTILVRCSHISCIGGTAGVFLG
jgi:hypothetical protein